MKRSLILYPSPLAILLCALLPWAAFASDYSTRDDVRAFVDEMVRKHGFDREELLTKFSTARRLDNVLESVSRPAEKVLSWKEYRPIFISSSRVKRGETFLREHRDTLLRAEREYGVPVAIIAAIIGVETYYGRHEGNYEVFDSLTTLGFDYPPRARFFRSELEQLLLLTREENIDVNNVRGSYAGAMGMPQFISSSYRAYAVDFDGDGRRDLWNSVDDAIGSVANYLSRHGWRRGEDIRVQARVTAQDVEETRNRLKPHTRVGDFREQGVVPLQPLDEDTRATLITLHGKAGKEYWLGLENFYVITRYNHSALYAMAVIDLSLLFNVSL